MKTNLFQANHSLRIAAMLLLAFFVGNTAFAGTENGNKGANGDVKSLKVRLERAEASYQKNLQKKLIADSLLNLGSTIHENSGDEIRASINATNQKAKEFSKHMRKLKKSMKSKSTIDVSQANSLMKALEEEYNKVLVAFDKTMKAQIVYAEEGTKHIVKGRAFKREAYKSLRYSEKNLKRAKMASEEIDLLTSN